LARKNSANTRIFTFGVGNDLNATFLDLLADQTRAASSFVRPGEDMEVKVSAFFDKISKPALTNLKLVAGTGVRLHDVYPPQLPDLFHGQQLIVMGRYQGQGAAAITLTGTVGTDTKEYVYELDFAAKAADKPFVEELWGRRKVGYLLEQIRLNGEKKELVDEVTALAKKYSIATPYTSYLVVPDGPMPVSPGARGGRGPLTQNGGGGGFGLPPGAAPALAAGAKDGKGDAKVLDFARQNQKKEGELAENRGRYADEELAKAAGANKPATGYPGAPAGGSGGGVGGPGGYPAQAPAARAAGEAKDRKDAYDQARAALRRQDTRGLQTDKLGVDLSCNINDLKNQARLQQKALQCVGSRNCLEIGGVWIDEGFTEKTPVCSVKALSDGYFRILERRPEMKDVFRLGNHLVWIAPSGTALVIDTNDGKEQLTDEEIDKLFTAAK
jgi:Ca-activated chloride channel family protein